LSQVSRYARRRRGEITANASARGLTDSFIIGRANTGKSSLFNAVVGRKNLLLTSKKAVSLVGNRKIQRLASINHFYFKGRTQALNFYRVGDPGQLVLVDAPGYGARGRVEWGKLFDQYVENRTQYAFPFQLRSSHSTNLPFFSIRLKRIYILFSAKHGLNAFDHQMLSHLCQKLVTLRGTQPYTLQAIITKADLVPTNNLPTSIALIQKAIWESAPLCLPAIVTSTALNPPFQIDCVRKNIADACGL